LFVFVSLFLFISLHSFSFVASLHLVFSPPFFSTYPSTGTDLISAAGHKLSAEPLLREDPHGSVLKMETYRLQQNKSNITSLEVLPYHQLLVAGTEDGFVKLFH
jgi:hypothetical protein